MVGRVAYLGPCTLPDLDLTSSMSERKKRCQAGATVPPTPEAKRSTAYTRHSLEILALRIEAIGTC